MRKLLVILGALGILALSFFIMTVLSAQKKDPPKKEVKESIRAVRTEAVKYGDIPINVRAFGRVSSAEPLDLISQVSGAIRPGSIKLKEGQKFSKGALIFKIEDTESRLDLSALKSNFLRDIASILPDFKIDFPNSFSTWDAYFKTINIDRPLPNLPKAKSDKEKTFLATKNIYSNYYSIKRSEENLKKHNVYAPYGGTITQVMLQTGSYVNPGGRVASVVRTDKLELKIPVDPNDISWIKVGSQANISSEDGQRVWDGEVIRVGDVVNQNTQSLDVFINIIANKNKVFDGLYLRVDIPGRTINSAMELPRNALVGGSQVYILQDSAIHIRDVQLHRVGAESVVFSGLEPNVEVVVEPLVNAYNLMKATKM